VLLIMVAFGTWGLAHRDGERRLRVRAELLRDGGPDLTAAMMDELRELHLGRARLDAGAPCASEQLRAAYDAAMRDDTGKPPTSPQPWRSRNRAGEQGPTAAGLALGGGGAG
jgi:hypothetical protein